MTDETGSDTPASEPAPAADSAPAEPAVGQPEAFTTDTSARSETPPAFVTETIEKAE